jgi:RimJ/RimL family protein N-acetyltransferase
MGPAALPLCTPSLLVRPFVREDAATALALSREASLRTWIPSQVYRDEAHATAVLEFLIGQFAAPADPRRGPFVLGLEHRADRELIGHVGLSPFEGEVEIGYAVAERYQGRGLASEAVVAVTRWAFAAFGIERLLGVTAAANVASQRTLERAGFALADERRMVFQGAEQDVRVYVLAARREASADAPGPGR